MKPEEEYEWAWEQSIYDKEDGRLWILEMNTALLEAFIFMVMGWS